MALSQSMTGDGWLRRIRRRRGDVSALRDLVPLRIERRLSWSVPSMSCSAGCGFPSPTDNCRDRPRDFNELLVENVAATLAVLVAGDSNTKDQN